METVLKRIAEDITPYVNKAEGPVLFAATLIVSLGFCMGLSISAWRFLLMVYSLFLCLLSLHGGLSFGLNPKLEEWDLDWIILKASYIVILLIVILPEMIFPGFFRPFLLLTLFPLAFVDWRIGKISKYNFSLGVAYLCAKTIVTLLFLFTLIQFFSLLYESETFYANYFDSVSEVEKSQSLSEDEIRDIVARELFFQANQKSNLIAVFYNKQMLLKNFTDPYLQRRYGVAGQSLRDSYSFQLIRKKIGNFEIVLAKSTETIAGPLLLGWLLLFISVFLRRDAS